MPRNGLKLSTSLRSATVNRTGSSLASSAPLAAAGSRAPGSSEATPKAPATSNRIGVP